MRIRSPANTGDITCGGEIREQVTSFTYLGSLITTTGVALRKTLKSGAGGHKRPSAFLRPVWRSKCISLWIKVRFFDSNVKSVLLYGSETWRLTKRIIAKLQAFINRIFRYILRVWWPKRISNEDLWKRTNQQRIDVTIRKTKWRWIGHTLRKPVTNITQQALEWNPHEARSRWGRPRR